MHDGTNNGGRSIFTDLKAPATFYLVRHGESEGNRELRIQGKSDRPLTDVGRDHARRAGDWLAGHPVDAIVASPLSRARETAGIIASTIASAKGTSPQEVMLDADLEEIDTGCFTDRTFQELQRDEPELWKDFSRESWQGVPDAERISDLEARSLRVWSRLTDLASQGHSRIVAVSHGGFIHWLIKTTFATGWDSWFPRIRITNCSISELRVEMVPQDPQTLVPMAEWYRLAWQPWNLSASPVLP